ncbi:MAG: prolipoprotein diacylglyceryl transferase [Aquificaceae bacterium]|jgi:phosphatidylglycerol:prolipoprotein diacylglycerol transferase|uniref:prolipoprotein diacylglyceryl transferase n=1 Tax=Hydrogenobacter sp. Uz 6-8 TaxID=3384828 RepID=UPI0030AB003C
MYPVLIEVFGIKIYTYGVLVALGALLAYWLMLRFAKKEAINPNHVENTLLLALLLGIVGGRLSYVIEHPEQVQSLKDILAIWNGGMNFFGGLVGGVLGALVGMLKYRLPFWKTADMAVVSLSIAHAIGRLGCTSAGCCYGKPFPVDGSVLPGIHISDRFPFFYVVFPPGAVAPPYMPLYPTQLMEFSGLILIFLILLLAYRRKPFDGFVFSLYMLLYGILRFSLEFYRGVTPPIPGVGLTWNQVVALLMVFASVVLALWLLREKRHEKVA